MLKLHTVTLRNVCQHTSISFTLGSGFIGIVGPNASGKSTCLRAIAYGLTGLVDGSWGSQQDLQQDGALVPGYVELQLIDGNDTYIIKRYCQGGPKLPDTLTLPDKSTIQRRSLVNAKLKELFGMDLSLLFSIVWSRQEALDWLLTSTPAYIDTFLSAVFDTSKLNTISAKLKTSINEICQDDTDYASSIADKEKQLSELQPALEAGNRTLQDLVVKRGKLDAEYADICSELSGKQKASDVQRELTGFLADIKYYESKIDPEVLGAEPVSENEEADHSKKKFALCYSIDSLINRLDKHIADAGTAITAANVAETTASGAVTRLTDYLEDTGVVCSLCGHPLEDSHSYKEHKLCELSKKDTVHESIAMFKTTLQVMIDVLEDVTDADQRCSSTYANISESYIALCNDVDSFKTATHTLTEKELRWQRLHSNEETLQKIAETRQQYDELSKVSVAPDDVFLKRDAVADAIRDVAEAISRTKVLIGSMTAKRDTLEAFIKEEQSRKAQADLNRQAASILTAIRESFGAQRSQALYMRSRIEALNVEISRLISTTDLPFVLYLDPETHSFKYTVDDHEHPAGHLSGAQKKMASMILQLALSRIVNSGIALQMFDEVDAALDPGNRIMLANLMRCLDATISGTVLLVTREQESLDQCTDLIAMVKDD